MTDPVQRLVLTLSCKNRPGIVAAVAAQLFEAGLNILDAQQFDDVETDRFFMRVVFNPVDGPRDVAALRAAFAPTGERFGMAWTLRDEAERRRVLLMVSRFDHCLADLLYRWRIGELAIDPVGIVANYPRETYQHLDFSGIPFTCVPISSATQLEREA